MSKKSTKTIKSEERASMKENKLLLPLNLQFFADDADDTDNQDTDTQDQHDNHDSKDEKQPPKTYTEEEVKQMIKDRIAREKKAAEKAVKEAEKLAKMNEEQKKQYELEKLQKELEEYKRKDAFYSLSKEASKMLSEKGINADDDLLSFVVKDTAEDTQSAVNSFVAMFNKHVEEGVKKALAGKPPKVTMNNKVLTKEQIMAEKDTMKRLKLIQENQHLFN